MHDSFFEEGLAGYNYASEVKRDLKNALSSYRDLRPKLTSFTFNNGTTQDLVCLKGTIPVRYKNSSYNIPIAIYLYQTHPHTAPMVFVRPTSTMQIKPSDFVDSTGIITLPYLSEWNHPGSDLVCLLGVLQVVFGERPPVFAKRATTLNQPSMPNNSIGFGQPNQVMPGSGWGTPPNRQADTMGIPMPSFASYPLPYPDPSTLPGPPNIPNSPTTSALQSAAISTDHIRLSLQSAIVERMRRIQNEVLCQHGDEMSAIRQSQSDMVCGGRQLRYMMMCMDTEQIKAEEAVTLLKSKNRELSDLLEKLRKDDHEPIRIDEAVDTTFPLYRQLLSSFSEMQAVEDAIFSLGSLLGKGVIDLDIFLKQIRVLSRKQFMLHVTVRECRLKAGLPI